MLWQEGRAVKTRWIANGKQPLVPVQTVAPELDDSFEATSESTGLVSSGADGEQSEQSKPISMVCEKMGPLKEKWSGLPTAAKVAVSVAGLLIAVLLMIVATTTASGLTFTVISGPCGTSAAHDCIRSPNYPANYGNDEHCTILASGAGVVSTSSFHTESRFDYLSIAGTHYSGSTGPNTVNIDEGDVIFWMTDNYHTKSGFEVCSRSPSADPSEWRGRRRHDGAVPI